MIAKVDTWVEGMEGCAGKLERCRRASGNPLLKHWRTDMGTSI
jgi:hypothetical protein